MDHLSHYPLLTSGNEIHLTPLGGTFFANGSPTRLSREEIDFLVECDGTHHLAEITPSAWTEAYGDIRFLLFISHLLDSGKLRLLSVPDHRPPRITGSREAFIPPHLSLELTTECNLRCRHCYRESDSSQHDFFPTADLLKLLTELHRLGLRTVELTGGEPLLHPDFLEILSFCAEKFVLVGVLSNGTILSKDLFALYQSMGDRLILSISLDGPDPETHDVRRGLKGSFRRTTAHIRALTEAGLNVRVAMTVDEGNFSLIEKTLLLARELGSLAFSYSPVLPFGRGVEWAGRGWRLDGKAVLQAELDLAARYKGFLTAFSEDTISGIKQEGCGAGYRTFAVDPLGNVRPCVTFGTRQAVIGNLLTQSPITVFRHPITFIMADLPVPSQEVCGDCRYLSFCMYCGLRGFYGSGLNPECTWLKLPAVQALSRYLKDAKTPAGNTPMACTAHQSCS
jgi:radical SAM protein with 4Fe4S-binding SPASM domain